MTAQLVISHLTEQSEEERKEDRGKASDERAVALERVDKRTERWAADAEPRLLI